MFAQAFSLLCVCVKDMERNRKYLLIPMHKIHEAIMVIVVMRTLGSICRKHQIIWSKTMPLCIRVGEDSSLQQLII